jgi:3-hydroxybutyryl-CoA dehydrogenase
MLSSFIKKIVYNHQVPVKSFGVVGSGQMGTGIAIVANRVANLNVLIYDSNQLALKKSEDFISGWLSKELSKNKITQDEINAFNSRMHFVHDMDAFK